MYKVCRVPDLSKDIEISLKLPIVGNGICSSRRVASDSPPPPSGSGRDKILKWEHPFLIEHYDSPQTVTLI